VLLCNEKFVSGRVDFDMTSVPQEILSGRNSADRSLQADFGVVLSRVIDSIENDPAQLRHAVYELARMKLRREACRRNRPINHLEVRRSKLALESAIEGAEVMYSRRDELRALQSLHRFIENSEIGRSEVMIEPRPPLLSINQKSTQSADTYHRLVFLARVKSPSPNLKRSLRWSGVAVPLRGATVAIIAVALCVVLSQLGSLGRQAALSLPSQPKSEPMVQPAIARVNGAPFAHFRHRRLVAAETPAVSPGDAPRYSGDYDPSTVGPDERPVKPPRPSCSTRTFKVPSEAGGETSVNVVRCNGQ
jgi:hypothetical protein